jgi:hypothetical protein
MKLPIAIRTGGKQSTTKYVPPYPCRELFFECRIEGRMPVENIANLSAFIRFR